MSRTHHHGKNSDRRIRVQGVRKAHPDLRRVARTLIALAELQEDQDMTIEDQQHVRSTPRRCRTTPSKPSEDSGGAA